MRADLVKREPEFLTRWEEERLYEQIRKSRKKATKRFILHDGPPFANGNVHMGTALNKVLKDIIVKYKTMTGHDAPYVPGWDCHGLPIEHNVVKSDTKLSPLQIRQRSEEFARKYIDVQRCQFKRLGVFGDWERPYLTLDKRYEANELRVFAEMVGQGLVYQDKKPVYWSTGCQTALAEAEVEYLEKNSPAIYVKFEVLGMLPKTSMVIWTTTPWTLPANLAVAIHPRLSYSFYKLGGGRIILCDSLPEITYERLKAERLPDAHPEVSSLLKLKLKHPFLSREVPILTDDFVAADTGTGCVHIAPGHGQDDYNLAKHLGLLSPVDDQGKFTLECEVPELVGKYVFDADKDVIALLRAKDKLIAEETIQHSYPHCWRSKTPVVFRAVEQWFIKLEDLKQQALAAIENVTWIPIWGKNRIRATVESRSDWCISRQRSWGVPLPIFYRTNGEAILDREVICKVADLVEKRGSHVWFELSADELARELGLPSGLNKRNETLDVWIDSGSSHAAVLKHHSDLDFPADLYLEGSDQHRGWFQSSLLTSVAVNQGQAPYRSVITNGFLMDLDGKKISKSSSYEKPKDAEVFIQQYGADIVRLWVASENYQNDIPLSEEIFTRISDTYRSIRNTLRILLGNLNDFNFTKDRVEWPEGNLTNENESLTKYGEVAVDRWMLGKLQKLIREVRMAYEKYEFHKVYHAINNFCAFEVSALYVDITKDRLYCDEPNSRRRRMTQTVMYNILSTLTRLLAPILSFTTEEVWDFLKMKGENIKSSVHLEEIPQVDDTVVSEYISYLDNAFGRILYKRLEVAEKLEGERQKKVLGKSIDARVNLSISHPDDWKLMSGHEDLLAEIFIVSQVELSKGKEDAVIVTKPLGKKCARSWRWDETVGQDPEYPDLSARDAAVCRAYLQKQGEVSSPAH